MCSLRMDVSVGVNRLAGFIQHGLDEVVETGP